MMTYHLIWSFIFPRHAPKKEAAPEGAASISTHESND
jgi:hypothetical protein